MSADINHEDPLTALLRNDNWIPRIGQDYPCGCSYKLMQLCKTHASIRGAEHYSPELIPSR